MSKILFYLLTAALVSGCSLFSKKEITGLPPDPATKALHEQRLKDGQDKLNKRKFAEASQSFEKFRQDFPQSIYFQSAQLGLAKAYEGLGQFAQATQLYRATIDATRSTQPEIAAEALYYSSFSFEALGDDARVSSSLKDAQNLKKYLSEEMALAEVPARLAATYYRIGQLEDAEIYYKQAERGVIQLQARQGDKVDPVWLSHVYYQMGVFSTNQISFDTVKAHMDTLQMMQKFSLRAIETEGKPWSEMAYQGLKDNYRDVWNSIQTIPLNKTLDPAAAGREQKETQIRLVGDILTMINELRNYKSPQATSNNMDSLLAYLDEMEKQGSQILQGAGEYSPLTPESQERQGLRREGIILKDANPPPEPNEAENE